MVASLSHSLGRCVRELQGENEVEVLYGRLAHSLARSLRARTAGREREEPRARFDGTAGRLHPRRALVVYAQIEECTSLPVAYGSV